MRHRRIHGPVQPLEVPDERVSQLQFLRRECLKVFSSLKNQEKENLSCPEHCSCDGELIKNWKRLRLFCLLLQLVVKVGRKASEACAETGLLINRKQKMLQSFVGVNTFAL